MIAFRSNPSRLFPSQWSRSSEILICVCLVALPAAAIAQSAAIKDSDAYRLQGEYLKSGRGVQVAAMADDNFRVLFHNGGLPGQGWDRSPIQTIEMDAAEVEELVGDAERVVRQSATLGAVAPQGAVVLFDGTPESLQQNWLPGAVLEDDGTLRSGCTTQAMFRDYRLHVEFLLPFMPDASGQGRGNSGVYHQGRYETQVLDSFGFENEGNTCGAIYGVKAADFNACLPPSTWQTYDVDFVSARWDASGNKISDAKLTVWLNGQLIHREQSAPSPTTAAPNSESSEPGPVYLQDHGNPVRYRNLWIVPLDAEKLALRPRVPGYERLAAASSSIEDQRIAGRILISELGCAACHEPGRREDLLDKKQAPILDQAAGRLRRGYVATLLNDVHRTKVGTTMPDLLHGLDEQSRQETIDALAAYVESNGLPQRSPRGDAQSKQRGKDLYSKIGCAVCHGFPDGREQSATTVSLPDLQSKYTPAGLMTFLQQPHSVRPSNRMPGMHLDDREAIDLVSYLIPDRNPNDESPNVNFQVFYGKWQKIPNLDRLKPVASGACEGLDLTVAGRTNDFAVRFDAFLPIERAGEYRFFLGSDDGSRLFIDGEKVIDFDGIHPHQTSSKVIPLEPGMHAVRVEYFQGGGEWTLDLEWESKFSSKQSIDSRLQLDREAARQTQPDPALSDRVARGKSLFTSVGCAKCHVNSPSNVAIAAFGKPPSLADASMERGCLADQPRPGVPNYALSVFQKEAIRSALSVPQSSTPTDSMVSKTLLTQLNCIACHQRDGWGGPESDKRELFQATIPEMGDEGRLPPSLNGVGDKLNADFLSRVLRDGVRHRPYTLVRMPQFGAATEGVGACWIRADRPADDSLPQPADEPRERILAAGRQLVGTKGLACAQCHTFGKERALGIQAIDLLLMTERLRPEWFYRYLLEPTRYRPGTRMPASFPNGSSVLKTVYHGDAGHQIDAMWQYLAQRDRAALPEGLSRNQIVLEPTDRPILYRNFLDGLSPRGIGVGYPGGINIAWDAESKSLSRAWQGQFIDASMHWRDRGAGRQRPLGDLVLNLENAPPVAVLAESNAAWPDETMARQHYRFRGYRLDSQGNPTFRYTLADLSIEDKPSAVVANEGARSLRRTLTIKAPSGKPIKGSLAIRIATGQDIVQTEDGTWSIDNRYRIGVPANNSDAIQVRRSGDRPKELLWMPKGAVESCVLEYDLLW